MRTSKIEIAIQHLRSAILLYRGGDAYYSVIHLAAAAEEILGQSLARNYPRSADTDDFSNARELQAQHLGKARAEYRGRPLTKDEISEVRLETLSAKNSVKHFTDPNETHVLFNAREKSRDELFNALFNYDLLLDEDEQAEDILEFELELREEELAEAEAYGARVSL